MSMDSVCVFCGSRAGNNPAYIAAAQDTGAAIARRGWRLIYGGGRTGLMGAVADAALAEGGEVIGVMPRSLLTREQPHPGVTRLHLVTSMHRRKALMSSLSDGYLTLPGGFGTLEEFFETVTWAQLRLHSKPCALLDVAGFWDHLLALVNTAVVQGFVPAADRGLILSGKNPEALLTRMEAYVPPSPVALPTGLSVDGPPVHRDLPPASRNGRRRQTQARTRPPARRG
jgi:uncharacterized protein (TIGR00730 family)